MDVRVAPRTDGSWDVVIAVPGGASRHVVRVPPGLAETLGCAGLSDAELVRASFGFLLEREPATSILRQFTLDEISRYYPEYGAELRRYVAYPPSGSDELAE